MLKVLLLFFTLFSSLFALDGKVVKVADGDTITILTDSKEQVKIRLFGIDAPERQQAFGQKSKDFWQSLLLVKEWKLKKSDINEQMVLNGYAWAYKQYSKDYIQQERIAKAKKLGFWQEPNPIEPSIFRKHHTKTKELKKLKERR